jgi:hypothetical protein
MLTLDISDDDVSVNQVVPGLSLSIVDRFRTENLAATEKLRAEIEADLEMDSRMETDYRFEPPQSLRLYQFLPDRLAETLRRVLDQQSFCDPNDEQREERWAELMEYFCGKYVPFQAILKLTKPSLNITLRPDENPWASRAAMKCGWDEAKHILRTADLQAGFKKYLRPTPVMDAWGVMNAETGELEIQIPSTLTAFAFCENAAQRDALSAFFEYQAQNLVAEQPQTPKALPIDPQGRGLIAMIKDELYPQIAPGVFDTHRSYNLTELGINAVEWFNWAQPIAKFTLPGKDGEERPRSAASMRDSWAIPVHRVGITLAPGLTGTGIVERDGQKLLLSSPLKPIKAESRFHEDIDQALRLMGGQDQELGLDYIASFRRFDKPTRILAMVGVKGGGKTFIPIALAKWAGQSETVDIESTWGKFNDDMLRGPVVFADEGLPNPGRDVLPLVDQLKKLPWREVHKVNRKGQSVMDIYGYLRPMMSTNSYSKFKALIDDSKDSQDAFADRVLVLEIGPAAAEYFEKLGGRKNTDEWLSSGRIFEHFTWLEDTRKAEFQGRALVKSNGRKFVERTASMGGVTGELLQALCAVCQAPNDSRWARFVRDYLRVESGQLWVCASLFRDDAAYRAMVPSARGVPNDTRLGEALRSLTLEGIEEKRFRIEPGSQRPKFRCIDVARLTRFAETAELDTDAIKSLLKTGVPALPKSPFYSVN